MKKFWPFIFLGVCLSLYAPVALAEGHPSDELIPSQTLAAEKLQSINLAGHVFTLKQKKSNGFITEMDFTSQKFLGTEINLYVSVMRPLSGDSSQSIFAEKLAQTLVDPHPYVNQIAPMIFERHFKSFDETSSFTLFELIRVFTDKRGYMVYQRLSWWSDSPESFMEFKDKTRPALVKDFLASPGITVDDKGANIFEELPQ